MIVRNYNYFFRTTCSIPHFKALFSATENIPPIKRIPNLSYFTKLINNEKDFVLPSGILCTVITRLSVLWPLRNRQQLTALIRSGDLEVQGDLQVVQNMVALCDLAEFDPG